MRVFSFGYNISAEDVCVHYSQASITFVPLGQRKKKWHRLSFIRISIWPIWGSRDFLSQWSSTYADDGDEDAANQEEEE
jgi:hypothetical protein